MSTFSAGGVENEVNATGGHAGTGQERFADAAADLFVAGGKLGIFGDAEPDLHIIAGLFAAEHAHAHAIFQNAAKALDGNIGDIAQGFRRNADNAAVALVDDGGQAASGEKPFREKQKADEHGEDESGEGDVDDLLQGQPRGHASPEKQIVAEKAVAHEHEAGEHIEEFGESLHRDSLLSRIIGRRAAPDRWCVWKVLSPERLLWPPGWCWLRPG